MWSPSSIRGENERRFATVRKSSQAALRGQQFRTAVAEALLHLGDVTWLQDSPLAALPEVERRSAGSQQLFAEGQALGELLHESLTAVKLRLVGFGKVALLRAALEGIDRSETIAHIAREHGRTREHFSRTYWKLAAGLVAEELARSTRSGRSGTLPSGHGNRVPAIQNFAALDERSSA
jgi:DNA-binding phage protein